LKAIKCLPFIYFSKLQKYSPNEAQKVWERPVSRKVTNKFNPNQALELLKLGSPTLDTIDSEGKQKLIEDYLEVLYYVTGFSRCLKKSDGCYD